MGRSKMGMGIAGAVSLCFSALLFSGAVADQSLLPGTTAGLEQIIVTAQRRSESVVEVPFSLQAFSGATLDQTGVRDLNELLLQIPGASEGHGNTVATRTYQIRGMSSYYGDSTVGYYVDDAAFLVPNRNYAPVVDTFDMNRVEVLRGPQGTLYGLGSLGGTIRFITNDPNLQEHQLKADSAASQTSGGNPNYDADLVINLPLVPDLLGVRITATALHNGGYAQSPSYPGDLNSSETDNIRGKVLFKPSDILDLKFTYQHTEVSDHWGQNLVSTDPPAFSQSSVVGRNRARYDTYSASADFDIEPMLIQLTSGFIGREDHGLGPFVGGPPPQLQPVLQVTGLSNMYTDELRLVSHNTKNFNWLLGAIYQNGHNNETPDLGIHVPAPSFLPLPPGTLLPVTVLNQTSDYRTNSYGVYGEASLNLLDDHLIPLVGLRYFSDERSFTNVSQAPVPGSEGASKRFSATSPRFNVAYKFNDTAQLYVNVAKGFRSGTFNTANGIAAAQAIGLTSIERSVNPDTVWSYELGTKFMAVEHRLEIELAVYRYNWSDDQLSFSVGPNQVQVIANAGEVHGRGAEYSIKWLTDIEGLSLQAAGNFNRTTFENLNDPATFAATPSIADGNQVASVPKQTHTLSTTYQRQLPITGLDGYANAGFTYLARQGDPGDVGAPMQGIPGGRLGTDHKLLRLRLGVQSARWGFYVFGENLLNDNGAIEVSDSGRTRYYPRVLGGEVTAKF